MGAAMGTFGAALGGQSLTNWVVDIIYNNSHRSGFDSPEKFHLQIIEWVRKINSGMPGKHFDIPSEEALADCYKKWDSAKTVEEKKRAIKDLLNGIEAKTADLKTTLATGLVVPPTAMICKKSAENIPAVGKIKIIPDFVFVPAVTFVFLAGVRLLKKAPQMHAPGQKALETTEKGPTPPATGVAPASTSETGKPKTSGDKTETKMPATAT